MGHLSIEGDYIYECIILMEEYWKTIEELTCNMDEDEHNEFLMDIDRSHYSLDNLSDFMILFAPGVPQSISPTEPEFEVSPCGGRSIFW